MTFSHHGTHYLRHIFCHFRGFKAEREGVGGWGGVGSETEAAMESKEEEKSKQSVAAF